MKQMETNLQKLHVQEKIWRGHNSDVICCVLLYLNDDK
jgi:hypothetical protein